MGHRVLLIGEGGKIKPWLTGHGFVVSEVKTVPAVTRELRLHRHDVVVVDGGADVLAAIRLVDERVPIVLLVKSATLAQATQAVRQGADHLLSKPVDLSALLIVVQRLVAVAGAAAPPAKKTSGPPEPFVGKSPAIQHLAEQAHRILGTQVPILIMGETGSGKGVLAAWLHRSGPRAEQPFVDINCAGLSREFLESELFGHVRGAFTGATEAKQGLLDLGHHGTVFLDEIGDIDANLQPRLLKVLEDKKFRRLGDVRDRVVDVHLIAATNADLAGRSRGGTFRADLYYRINTITLTVPPLRQRLVDLPALVQQMLGGQVEVGVDALDALASHDWPGNVRELRNVLDRAVLMSRGQRITRKEIVLDGRGARRVEEGVFVPITIEEGEQRLVERTLEFTEGDVDRAALLLGISRSALYKRLVRYREGR